MTNSKKGLLLGISLSVLAFSGTSVFAQSGSSTVDAVNSAVQSAVQSAIQSARDQVYTARDARDRVNQPPVQRSRFSAEPTIEDSFAALGYAPRDSKSPMYAKAAPVYAPSAPPITFSIWGSGTGTKEDRDAINAGPPVGLVPSSQSKTGVGLGGADFVKTGLFYMNDAIIIGGFGGGSDSRTTTGLPFVTNTQVRTGTGGGYLAYLLGGFSSDMTLTFNSANSVTSFPVGFGPPVAVHSESYSFASNYQYRFNMDTWWMEPTAGYVYTRNRFDNALIAGMPDYSLYRVMGGVRFGSTWAMSGIKVQPSVYGGVYEDVSRNPGLPVGAPPTDLNKLFGKGTAKLNFIMTNNFSLYVQGEVYGRTGVRGETGTIGARYTF